jgi:protein-S-isoprenylcysteine O-methyltransferase Ste14
MIPTAGSAVFTTTGTLPYLGLAILSGGGFATFFNNPERVALVLILVALGGASAFTCRNLSPGEREDRGDRWVILAFALLGLLIAILPPYTDRVGLWTLDEDTVRWLGVALFAAGGALRLWPVFVLGRGLSGLVAIQPGHTLVTGGVYSLIRHPSYLGLLVNSLGWSLAFWSGVGVLLTLLIVLPVPARIRAEEVLLHSQFGGDTMSTAVTPRV